MTEGRPYFSTPALSPDGSLLAFAHASNIWLVDAAGGNAELLTAHQAWHGDPCFSPDGRQIAFASSRTGNGDVYVLPLNGGEVRRLTYHHAFCSVADWDADSQAVLFLSDREQQGRAIYRVSLAGETPVLLYAEPYEDLGSASVSPDGTTLAFTTVRSRWWRRGPDQFAPCDIWLGAVQPLPVGEAAQAAALPRKVVGEGTRHPYAGRNLWPLWAPDGTGLYFVSTRDGNENIWYEALETGELRQMTHFTDGRVLWPSIARSTGLIVFERGGDLWRLDPQSGESEPVAIQVRSDTKYTPVYVQTWTRHFSELSLSPDGKKVAFVARGEIFADFADKETDRERRQGPSFRVTNTHARESEVIWTPDSRSLLYVSDRHGEPELYRYDFATHTETRLTDDPAPKRDPRCSPDGEWVAYLSGNEEIHLLNLKDGTTRPFARGSFIRSSGLAWSPDSRWLAFLSHDERFFSNIYVQRLDETEARQITFLSNIEGSRLLWSPDGRFLIFTSGQYRIESQIIRVDLRPPEPQFREAEFEKLFEEKKDPRAASDKPDKAAAPAAPEPEPEDEPEDEPEGEPDGESDGGDAPAEPAAEEPAEEDEQESSAEQEAQAAEEQDDGDPSKRVEIVFEGIERRLRFLTPAQMDADAMDISRNSRDLLFRAVVAGKTNLWTLPLDEPRQEQPPRQLIASSSGKGAAQFAPEGKSYYYLDDGQITIRKFPHGSDATTLHVRGEVLVDFHQEKQQVFGEAWRLLRDTFFDANFRGQDWPALREQFAPYVAGTQTPGELSRVLNLMIGELRASHTGNGWSGGGWDNDSYTGIIFDPVQQAASGALRVAEVLPDSPAALLPEPPQPGEYLVALDGTPLTPQSNLDDLLQRKVGRRVELRFAAAPDASESRSLNIRPIDSDDYEHLRYRAWVNANKAYVHRISEGRLGYVHIEAMSYEAYQQFLVDLDAETHSKVGVVLDIRYNGGGHIATFILDVLARPPVLHSGFRGSLVSDPYHFSGNRTLNRPTVLVTNESSASNAEIFTEIYRRLELGQVVGKPTAGAVIGTINVGLLNGSYLRLPIYSYHTPEGEDLEGTGRSVDILVERPVGEWAAGRDRQLDSAVEALLATIDKES